MNELFSFFPAKLTCIAVVGYNFQALVMFETDNIRESIRIRYFLKILIQPSSKMLFPEIF